MNRVLHGKIKRCDLRNQSYRYKYTENCTEELIDDSSEDGLLNHTRQNKLLICVQFIVTLLINVLKR